MSSGSLVLQCFIIGNGRQVLSEQQDNEVAVVADWLTCTAMRARRVTGRRRACFAPVSIPSTSCARRQWQPRCPLRCAFSTSHVSLATHSFSVTHAAQRTVFITTASPSTLQSMSEWPTTTTNYFYYYDYTCDARF